MLNDKHTWNSSEMGPGYPLEGDIGQEFIVPSPNLMHDKFTAEIHSEIMDKINSIDFENLIMALENMSIEDGIMDCYDIYPNCEGCGICDQLLYESEVL